MSFVSAEVTAILGAKVNPAGFSAYTAAINRAAAAAARGEAASGRYDSALARSNATMAKTAQVARVGLVGGLLGVTAAIAGSVKKAADFEQQLSSLQAVSGANVAQMGKLKKAAMDAGAATKFSALDAAKAQTELAKGGLSVAKIMSGGLKGALALAAAGEMDLADAASTTANALNLFKLNGSQSVHVADALATAANQTTADVSDFALALTQGGAAAKAAGLSFDQTVTYLEALANAGVKGSDAGTSMKAALTQIAHPTKQSAAAMKQLNLEFFDAQGKIRPLPAIARNLDEAFGGLTNQQRLQAAATIAGTDGMRGLLALYDSSPAQLAKLQTGLEKQGSAAEMAAKKQDNLKGKIENLKGSLETAGIALGSKLLPALTSGAEQATEAINNAVQNGSLDHFADGLIAAGRTAVQVVGDIAGALHSVLSAVSPVVGAVVHLADALGLLSPTGIEAMIAAFAGFKVVSTILPQVMRLGTAFSLLGTAAKGGEMATLASMFVKMPGPIGLAAGAAAVLGAGLVALGAQESDEARLARENAEAHRDQAKALRELQDAELEAADKGLGAIRAQKDATAAHHNYNELVRQGKKDTKEAGDALLDWREKQLRATVATKASTDAIKTQHDERARLKKQARDDRDTALSSLEKAGDKLTRSRAARTQSDAYSPTGDNTKAPTTDAERSATREQAQAQANVNAKLKDYLQAQARASVSDLSRNRLMQASTQIQNRYAVGIASLVTGMKGIPDKKTTQILLKGGQKVLSEVGQIMATASKQDKIDIRAVLSNDGPVKVKLAALKAIAENAPPARVRAVVEGNEPAKVKLMALRALAEKVDDKYVAKVLADTGDSKSKVEALSAAINDVHGKNVSVMASVNTAAVNAFQAAIDALHGKSVPVKTRARGRGPGESELSLVGEGRDPRELVADPAAKTAFVTNGPMLTPLSSSAYVIPYDRMQESRAKGLMARLAEDWGIPAFGNGRTAHSRVPVKIAKSASSKKAPAGLGLPDPGKVPPAELPLAEMQDREQKARKSLTDATTKVHDLPDKIKAATKRVKDIRGRNAKTKATKDKKKRDLEDARGDLKKLQDSLAANKAAVPKRRSDWNVVKRDLAQARRFQAAITKTESLADIAANDMRLANLKGDAGAWNTAKGKRVEALRVLQQLLGNAAKITGKPNSQIAADIAKQLSEANVSAQELDGEKFSPEKPTDNALSQADQDRLDVLDQNVALAALTDDGNVDDAQRVTERRDFLEGLLSSAQSSGRSAAVVGELATMVKQARDDAKSFTQDTSPDQQAIIDQQRGIIDLATKNAAANAQALAVFTGSGDIGSGGGNAWGAAQPQIVQNINTLHPGSPDTLAAIAAAANAGNSLQNGIASSRLRVG